MEAVREFTDKTDFPIARYLQVNNCGSERVTKYDYTILRSKGRKDYHFLYVRNGKIDAEINGEKVCLVAGQCIVYLPGVPQKYVFTAANDPVSYYVHFTGTVAEEAFSRVQRCNNMVYDIVDRTAFEGLFHQLVNVHNNSAFVDILEENGLLLQIIALLARSAEAQPQHSKSDILFATSYMREHFHEPLDIKTCADLLHISVSWFSHLFTQVIGVSPHKYLLSLRIDKAKELLSYSSMNIAEISASVGFPDSLYFSRLFRRYTGYSPMNYRNLVSR